MFTFGSFSNDFGLIWARFASKIWIRKTVGSQVAAWQFWRMVFASFCDRITPDLQAKTRFEKTVRRGLAAANQRPFFDDFWGLWFAMICSDLHVFYSVFWRSAGSDLQWFAGCKSAANQCKSACRKALKTSSLQIKWFATICRWFAIDLQLSCAELRLSCLGEAVHWNATWWIPEVTRGSLGRPTIEFFSFLRPPGPTSKIRIMAQKQPK